MAPHLLLDERKEAEDSFDANNLRQSLNAVDSIKSLAESLLLHDAFIYGIAVGGFISADFIQLRAVSVRRATPIRLRE